MLSSSASTLAALAALTCSGLILGAAGCGSTNPNSVTGTVKGTPLEPNDAVSGIYNSSIGTLAVVALTTETSACTTFTSGAADKDATTLYLSMGTIDLATLKTVAATAPGTFTVYSGQGLPKSGAFSTVSWSQSDATCTATTVATGATGTVTITAVDNGAYTGTGDVTFSSGDHVTFAFGATACAAISNAQNVTTTSCM